MSLRFRRSLPLGKFLRLNISKTGASISVGPRGASVNVGPRGVTRNIGLPGTGLSDRTTIIGPDEGPLEDPSEGEGPSTDPRDLAVAIVAVILLLSGAAWFVWWVSSGRAPTWVTTLLNTLAP